MIYLYVVANSTPYGCTVTGDRAYTDFEEAKKEWEYYQLQNMDWMRIFTFRSVDKIPEYMQKQLDDVKKDAKIDCVSINEGTE